MTLEDLKRIQQINTDLLVEVDRICKKHGIQYFLMYGTLLGAIRHRGVIPWDDDVDIGMTRDNYMKFLQVASEELDSKYHLVIMGSGSPRYLSEIKIGRKGTHYYLPGTEKLNIMSEIQLDIFLVDYIKSEAQNKRLRNQIRRILELAKLNWDEKKLLFLCIEKSSHKGKIVYVLGLTILHSIRTIFGELKIEKFIYNMYVDESKTSGQVGVVCADSIVRTWKADEPIIQKEYEGMSFPVLACYHDILTKQYGDYMQFPPENKRYKKRFEHWVFEET